MLICIAQEEAVVAYLFIEGRSTGLCGLCKYVFPSSRDVRVDQANVPVMIVGTSWQDNTLCSMPTHIPKGLPYAARHCYVYFQACRYLKKVLQALHGHWTDILTRVDNVVKGPCWSCFKLRLCHRAIHSDFAVMYLSSRNQVQCLQN